MGVISLPEPMPATALSLVGKRAVILGLARQGAALARFFVAQGAHVTLSDSAPAEKLTAELDALRELPIALELGGHPRHLLDGCDLLCLSGGVPPQIELVQTAVERKIPLSNDSLLTLQLARAGALGPTIAITGSSGKTTTTTLVGKMLEASGLHPHVGGNIGTPLIDRLAAIAPGEPVVLELSSFQLELFDSRLAFGNLADLGPDIAAILNVTPNHLDRHPGMAAYVAAKLNLLRHLRADSVIVLNADDPVTRRVASGEWRVGDPPLPSEWGVDSLLEEVGLLLAGRHSPLALFSLRETLTNGAWLEGSRLVYEGQAFCDRSEIKLRGDHNVGNLLAAAAIAGAAGATVVAMREVACGFTGVPHRLEVVAEIAGVTWINDSIATAPERALAGLRSFADGAQTLILLVGGKDKKLPWEALADSILQRVDYLIGFGQAGPMIVDTVKRQAEFRHRPAPAAAVVQRLDDAVRLAAYAARPGTVVLLSPGGTSYDSYRDFEARGEHFRELVRELSGSER